MVRVNYKKIKKTKLSPQEKEFNRQVLVHESFVKKLTESGITPDMPHYDQLPLFEPNYSLIHRTTKSNPLDTESIKKEIETFNKKIEEEYRVKEFENLKIPNNVNIEL